MTKQIEDYPELKAEFEVHTDYKENFYEKAIVTEALFVRKKILSMQQRIDSLAEQNKELQKQVKKAFWWSAEFTHTVHDGNIQRAWEDYNQLNKESK